MLKWAVSAQLLRKIIIEFDQLWFLVLIYSVSYIEKYLSGSYVIEGTTIINTSFYLVILSAIFVISE